MRAVRVGVFETNSSSTHSITMCSEEEFEKWKDGELLFNRWEEGNNLATKEEAITKLSGSYKGIPDEDIEDTLEDEGWCTYDKYFNSYDLETFVATYTTKKGEVVVAFGKYGHDG